MSAVPRPVGALLSEALGAGPTLAVAADRLDGGLEGAAARLDAPEDAAALEAALAGFGDGAFGAAVAGGWGEALAPEAVAAALARKVRPGGAVVLAAPTVRPGFRAAVSRLLRRRRACAFEDLCEGLLKAGLVDVRAVERTDRPGLAVAWARVPARARIGPV